MTDQNRFKVSLADLEKVHVPAEDLVEEHDTAPPIPDIKAEDERRREEILRVAGAGF